MIVFRSNIDDGGLTFDVSDALAARYGITKAYECNAPFSLGFNKDPALLSPIAVYSGSIRLQFILSLIHI